MGATLQLDHPGRLVIAVFCAALLGLANPTSAAEYKAHFAGGCFWCMESDFQKVPGVSAVISGFTGGALENPTYRGNHEGHYEAVEVTFDDEVVSYSTLLKHFWRNIDPLDDGGQFCDRGFSYKTALFTSNEQRSEAEVSLQAVEKLFTDEPVATVLLPMGKFWPVEEYHQDYADKNPLRYKYYRWNCGRDQRLESLWGDVDWE
jgi:peptide-methionine (S)-S-oxide reductase